MGHFPEVPPVAVGDPWYRPVNVGEAGQSLIVARTQRGLEAVRAAVRMGTWCRSARIRACCSAASRICCGHVVGCGADGGDAANGRP